MSVIGQQKIKTLSCHLCNMFGMEYRGGVSKEHHTKSKCHIFMKNFWENGLWPGPPHKANSQQLTPQIFSFHYEKVSDDPSSKSRGGLILCRLCDEICLDAVGLYQHQSDVKHARMLEKLKLASSHAILRLCPLNACPAYT
uniref:C2H2-type domain-containing protein n=1 Tax=Romanomermis culicivorax TaxID=13658 RepID=A0A915HYF8_ROMCU